MLSVGTVIGGRLRIDQILGAGGMGIVAAATHLELGHRVAVKVLRPEVASNPTTVERFLREARSVVRLQTEHVCRVFDVGRLDDGLPYIVMELLDGNDLSKLISRGPLPVPVAVDYVMQACVALREAHAAGIIHRDLKPANLFVMRRPDGTSFLKVLDFGIAKALHDDGPALTHTTSMLGSPQFMSPEQLLSSRDVDARTDIWALGVTLFQLVSGRMPFSSTNLTEIAVKIASEPPPSLDGVVPPQIAAVITRCLEKDMARRYQNVDELAAALAPFRPTSGAAMAAAPTLDSPARVLSAAMTPPVVASNAMTAAGSMPVAMGAAGTPAPLQSAHPGPGERRRAWPLVLAALLLVGAAVGITLAVTSSSGKPAAAPQQPASASDASVSDAAVVVATAPVDAPAATGTPAPDPWATPTPKPIPPGAEDGLRVATPEETAEMEAMAEDEPEPTPPDKARAEKTTTPGIPTMQEVKNQMAMQCKAVVDNPQMTAYPQMAAALAICHCALDRVADARAQLAKAASDQRASIVQTCAQFGHKLGAATKN